MQITDTIKCIITHTYMVKTNGGKILIKPCIDEVAIGTSEVVASGVGEGAHLSDGTLPSLIEPYAINMYVYI